LYTTLLFAGMVVLLGILGLSFGGVRGLLWAGILAVPFLLLGQRLSPRFVLRMLNARPLSTSEAPRLYQVTRELSSRARLSQVPQVYYVPSERMNAFGVGNRDRAAIGITAGLIRGLSTRELTGVLAHEITHIKHNDIRVMGFAHLIGRMTGMLSMLGQGLLFLNLPLLLFGRAPVSWLGVVLLLFAPTLSSLLQLALSRTREFDADLGAAQLTGDPVGLAMALKKMERFEESTSRQVFVPGYRTPQRSLLRTHPETGERVRRLLELTGTTRVPGSEAPVVRIPGLDRGMHRPRERGWYIRGVR
jgi:heat shock protein HtpX